MTDNEDYYKLLKSLRRHGFDSNLKYGYNSLLSDDHANQLSFLLSKFEKLQKLRKKVFEKYKKNLPQFNFVTTERNHVSSYHKLVILVEKRDELKTYLAQNGIETKIHYPKILDAINIGQYPNAEKICSQALSLPIYPHLKMKEVDYVCERIKKFYGI